MDRELALKLGAANHNKPLSATRYYQLALSNHQPGDRDLAVGGSRDSFRLKAIPLLPPDGPIPFQYDPQVPDTAFVGS